MVEKNKETRTITDRDYKQALSKRFGNRVRSLMDEKGLSQAELARRSGTSRSVINTLLKGERNPSLLTALTISRALGSSLDQLVSGNLLDLTDNQDTVNKTFKIDFLQQLAKLLTSADYYSNQLKVLTEKDKDTILRLVRAYLNVSESGTYRGDEK